MTTPPVPGVSTIVDRVRQPIVWYLRMTKSGDTLASARIQKGEMQ
jgi:hypothetical protein